MFLALIRTSPVTFLHNMETEPLLIDKNGVSGTTGRFYTNGIVRKGLGLSWHDVSITAVKENGYDWYSLTILPFQIQFRRLEFCNNSSYVEILAQKDGLSSSY